MISLIYDENSPYKPADGGSSAPAPTGNGGSGGGSAASAAAPTAAPTSPAPTNSGDATAAPTTAAPAPSDNNGGGNDTPAPSSDAPTEAPPAADALPSDNAGILALYTELVDTMKAAKPAYRRIEYQTMPEEYRNFGSVLNAGLKIAEGMITTKEKAEQDPSVHNQGDDPGNIPIRDNVKGCLLTDASKIKTASCRDNGDGTVTLMIELIDESNPKPVPAGATSTEFYTSAMFFPMDQAGIDDIINKFSGIATLNSLDLVYTGCTVTCVFDTASKKIRSLTYVEPVDIKADVKAAFIPITGSVRVVDTMEITEIAY